MSPRAVLLLYTPTIFFSSKGREGARSLGDRRGAEEGPMYVETILHPQKALHLFSPVLHVLDDLQRYAMRHASLCQEKSVLQMSIRPNITQVVPSRHDANTLNPNLSDLPLQGTRLHAVHSSPIYTPSRSLIYILFRLPFSSLPPLPSPSPLPLRRFVMLRHPYHSARRQSGQPSSSSTGVRRRKRETWFWMA